MQPETPSQPPLTAPSIPAPTHEERDDDMLGADEHVLDVIHRSFIGIITIYFIGLAAAVAALVLILEVSPNVVTNPSGGLSASSLGLIGIAAILIAFVLFVATYVYRQSRLLVTDKSLVQIMQRSLFSRKVSRLSMSNVEDVSAEQRGFLATVFNYGTLNVQTAGEMDNFVFTLCPNPNKLADKIIDARQAYAQQVEARDQ